MNKNKRLRQGQITKVIGEQRIESQEELRRELGRRGMRVNQATLSRDIHELGLVKTGEGYRALSAAAPGIEGTGPQALGRVLKEFLSDIRPAQNILVLKTPPGSAQTLAVALDSEKWKEVAGTVAGDDTVLIVTPSPKARAALQKRLEDMLK
jgi:transcriptional regulator of arginine metabolism